MKKGFTLIELLAVIIILSFVALITVPAVGNLIDSAKQHAYEANLVEIKNAASDWALLNTKYLPSEGDSIVVYLGELKKNGNIDLTIRNPLTGKLLSNNTSVTISRVTGNFVYELNLVEVDETFDLDAPLLIITGDVVDYVEVGTLSNYVVPLAYAKDSEGNAIDALITHQIIKDGEVVFDVDTSTLGVYTIVYTVTYQNDSANYEKKVIVRDTTKPILDVGDTIICNVSTIPSNLLLGVTVEDNSGEVIIPTVDSKIENAPGSYFVYYTATDSSGNSITKRKEVIVNE